MSQEEARLTISMPGRGWGKTAAAHAAMFAATRGHAEDSELTCPPPDSPHRLMVDANTREWLRRPGYLDPMPLFRPGQVVRVTAYGRIG